MRSLLLSLCTLSAIKISKRWKNQPIDECKIDGSWNASTADDGKTVIDIKCPKGLIIDHLTDITGSKMIFKRRHSFVWHKGFLRSTTLSKRREHFQHLVSNEHSSCTIRCISKYDYIMRDMKICLQPKYRGDKNQETKVLQTRFRFSKKKKKCVKFQWHGPLQNKNNFKKRMECELQCFKLIKNPSFFLKMSKKLTDKGYKIIEKWNSTDRARPVWVKR